MTVFGTISAFDPTTDKWNKYMQRLQFYFTANGIKDDSKKMYSVIEQFWTGNISAIMKCSPSSPFDTLFIFGIGIKDESPPQTATIHYCSMIPVKFQAAFTPESMTEYFAALKKLAEFCNYGKSLDEILHDRFICGTAYPAVQKWLLTESDLTFT